MNRWFQIVLMVALAAMSKTSLASVPRKDPGIRAMPIAEHVPNAREDTRAKLYSHAVFLVTQHCALDVEIHKTYVLDEERVALLEHADVLGEVLRVYRDSLRSEQNPKELLISAVLAGPLSARLAALKIELTAARLSVILRYDRERISSLPDSKALRVIQQRLDDTEARLEAIRARLDDIETNEAFRDLAAVFVPLLEEIYATDDLIDVLVRSEVASASPSPF